MTCKKLLLIALVGCVVGSVIQIDAHRRKKQCAADLTTVVVRGVSYSGQRIETFGNSVDILDNDVCVYDQNKQVIACKSGILFEDVGTAESALTGTPGHVMYGNYIGRLVTQPSQGMPGSGKRIDFCDGACERK